MIRALLVDDEPLSLARLSILLGRFEDVQIVGTAENGLTALKLLSNTPADVLFLDVEMPEMDGFDLIEALGSGGAQAPLVVFVTAFPRFAADAFDTGAIDFLTKPIRADRIARAVERVRQAMSARMARGRLTELLLQLDQLRSIRSDVASKRNYLWVQRRGEAVRLDLDKLDRVAAEGEYVRLFVEGHEYLHRASVTAMAAKLDPDRYVRVHRSHIVRLDQVASIKRRPTGSQSLLLKGGDAIPVGRRYRHSIASAAET
jgi:DNA-binding LytR/AlgR family response regulator